MGGPSKGRADFLDLGDWNVVCYECGRKRKASYMKRHWQGYYVCPEHWEPRQPQDFARGVPDDQTPPWVQPMPADLFVPINYDRYGNDENSLDESVSKEYDMVVRMIPIGTGTTNQESTNTLATNGNTTNPGPVTDMTLSENVEFVKGRLLSDSMSLSESLVFDIGPNPTESLLISESLAIDNTDIFVENPGLSEVLSFNTAHNMGNESYGLSEGFVATLTRPTLPVTNGSPTNTATTD